MNSVSRPNHFKFLHQGLMSELQTNIGQVRLQSGSGNQRPAIRGVLRTLLYGYHSLLHLASTIRGLTSVA